MAAEGRARRVAGLVWGVALVLWLPLEDQTTTPALGLAAALCGGWLWGAWRLRPAGWGWLGLGALAGLAVSPLAVGLLLVKSGLHAHGFLEIGPRALLAALAGAPAWGVLGALVGALGLWFKQGGRPSRGGEE